MFAKISTAPLRYGLHRSFTDINKSVKRTVAVELETLARVLDAQVTLTHTHTHTHTNTHTNKHTHTHTPARPL